MFITPGGLPVNSGTMRAVGSFTDPYGDQAYGWYAGSGEILEYPYLKFYRDGNPSLGNWFGIWVTGIYLYVSINTTTTDTSVDLTIHGPTITGGTFTVPYIGSGYFRVARPAEIGTIGSGTFYSVQLKRNL